MKTLFDYGMKPGDILVLCGRPVFAEFLKAKLTA